MQLRLTYLWITVLCVCILNACTAHIGPLRATIDHGQVVMAAEDVEEIYLKYGKDDQRYFAVIELNAAGRDKMGRLLSGKSGGELSLFVGKRLLTKLPVMTERIDRLLIKFDDQQSAVNLLKDLS